MLNKTILFVASTLPAVTIKSNLDRWNVNKIILANNSLWETYKYVLKDRNDIQLVNMPGGFLLNFFFLFKTLLFSRISKIEIIFFHECCWILFDLLINLINNKSKLFPQVTMKSFQQLEIDEISLCNKEKLLILLFFQKKRFIPHKSNKDNNSGIYVVWCCYFYNSNIKKHSIEETKQFRNSKISSNNVIRNKVLILTSRDFCSDNELTKIYLELIQFFKKYNINYTVKDHPNISSRLNIPKIYIDKYIAPELPIELIEDNFQYVIGLCSTGLIYYTNRSISLLNLLEENKEMMEKRKQHLLCLPGGDLINFPQNTSELYGYFI